MVAYCKVVVVVLPSNTCRLVVVLVHISGLVVAVVPLAGIVVVVVADAFLVDHSVTYRAEVAYLRPQYAEQLSPGVRLVEQLGGYWTKYYRRYRAAANVVAVHNHRRQHCKERCRH